MTGPLALIGLLALAYPLLAMRDPRGRRPWRSAAWVGGCAALAAAASPPLSGHDAGTHVARHLLLGMFAPLGLVLAAPVTLLLRVGSPAVRRAAVRVLRSRSTRLLAHPVTAALLSTGGLYVVMLTPLPAAHPLVDAHYLAAGCLFAWAIAGPDPAPHRPGPATRTAVLVVAAGAHAYLAKHLYAAAPDADAAAAAALMYYGGDVAELLLATALFAGWYRGRRRLRVGPRTPRGGPIGVEAAPHRA